MAQRHRAARNSCVGPMAQRHRAARNSCVGPWPNGIEPTELLLGHGPNLQLATSVVSNHFLTNPGTENLCLSCNRRAVNGPPQRHPVSIA